jgi:hypothetical protein
MLKQLMGCTAVVSMVTFTPPDVGQTAFASDSSRQIQASSSLEAAARRCPRPLAQSETLHYEDVTIRGHASPGQLETIGRSIYLGDRRHPGAFYYSAERGSFIGRTHGEVEILVPSAFIERVLSHLSAALTRGYARSLYFADLGHGHLLVPLEEYRSHVEPAPPHSQELYDALLNSRNLMVLYHAAEQMLKVVNGRPIADPMSRHYVDRRNIVGSFTDRPQTRYLTPQPGDLHNTQGDPEGYRAYGSIEFTWNRNACFPVQAGARTVYVDLSFESPSLRHQPVALGASTRVSSM